MQTVELIIESAKDGKIWGRVMYEDDLIVDQALNVLELQKKMKGLLMEFHELKPKEITFDVRYEAQGFFESIKYVRATEVARYANISPELIRQYSSGKKVPSLERAKEIETAIHEMAKELLSVRLTPRSHTKRKKKTLKKA